MLSQKPHEANIRWSAVTRETREREKCDIKENKTKNLKRKNIYCTTKKEISIHQDSNLQHNHYTNYWATCHSALLTLYHVCLS